MDRHGERIGTLPDGPGPGGFVGRTAELDLFRSLLATQAPTPLVLQVHGPGGVGKTTLIREFERLAAEDGRFTCRVDGRQVEISPSGFLHGLRQALAAARRTGRPVTEGVPEGESGARGDLPPGSVLLIDSFEFVAVLDSWLRETFLPQLPGGCIVVVAGRNPPALEWRTGRGGSSRTLRLEGLGPDEGMAYLAARNVPPSRQKELLSRTGGHPLALAVLAHLLSTRGTDSPLRLEEHPDVLHLLLQRILEGIPSPRHRQALAVSAIAHTTTEALLAEILGNDDAPGCLDWLRSLSFVEQGLHGIFPHDVVRELLDADLRWRDGRAHRELAGRVFGHLQRRIEGAAGAELQRLRLESLYLFRRDPGIGPFLAWDALGSAYAEVAAPHDAGEIEAMVQCHQGAEAAAIARHWLEVQPAAFQIFRQADGTACGFMANLEPHRLRAVDLERDPATVAMLAFLDRHGPLPQGDEIVYLRFWMHRTAYQAVSPALNLTISNSLTHWLTHPRLAWNFIAVAEPEFWRPHFESIGMPRVPEADFAVGGHRYGLFAHDWRAEPAAAWKRRRRDTSVTAPVTPDDPPRNRTLEPVPEEFADAVRQALRDCSRPMLLLGNPLMHTRLARDPQGGGPSAEALRAALVEAAASLGAHPRDRRSYRAVWHTYIEPAPTQERAAELLRLPFSTYRYHLKRGLGLITAGLWKRLEGAPTTGSRP